MVVPNYSYYSSTAGRGAEADAVSENGRWEAFSVRAPLAMLSPLRRFFDPTRPMMRIIGLC